VRRLRSYSLLNFLGAVPTDLSSDPTYPDRHKQKVSQIRKSTSVMAFVCEDADSINDGIFVVFPSPESWCDYPANRHARSCPLSFVDGHVECWKWKSDPPDDGDDLARIQGAIPDP
jgi:prepilin-type processing-associated H-X9-DG protein